MANFSQVNVKNRETRDELGTQPSTKEAYKTWIENVKVEVGPTIVKKQNIGHAFVVGHPVNGRIGNGYNGVDGEQIVIGSQALGDLTVARVTNPRNRFIERFWFDNFTDSNNTTSAVVDTGNGRLQVDDTGTYTSTSIFLDSKTVVNVTPSWEESGGTLTIEMSADGGSNWESVSNNIKHDFTNTGTDLRYRVSNSSGSTGYMTVFKAEYNTI